MSDGDKKPAAADAASASAAAAPADGEVLKKPGKEAQSAADKDAEQKKKEAEISPEQLAEKKDAYLKAKAEYEEACGEKKKADAKKLRVGSYVIDKGTQRPFVYIPKDFDLKAQGAIGQVLDALGVKAALRQAARSGLKLIQRRQHAYKEQLVTLAEKQLQFEIATISQLAIKYDKERSKKMEDEVAAAEEKRKNAKSQKKQSEDSETKDG